MGSQYTDDVGKPKMEAHAPPVCGAVKAGITSADPAQSLIVIDAPVMSMVSHKLTEQ